MDVDNFIPLLSERVYAVNPHVRQFLVSWLTVLGSVPEIGLLKYLPTFLHGLFKILSDPSPVRAGGRPAVRACRHRAAGQGRVRTAVARRWVFGATGVERFAHRSRRGLGFSGGRACQRLARGSLHALV